MFEEQKPATITEVSKSQMVRVWDFTMLGPFMLYLAFKKRNVTKEEKLLLALFGTGVIYYNFTRWNKNRQTLNLQRQASK